MNKLTPEDVKEYTKDPKQCPFCQEEDPTYGFIEVDGGAARQEASCPECGAEWSDTYHFAGIITDDGPVYLPKETPPTPLSDFKPGTIVRTLIEAASNILPWIERTGIADSDPEEYLALKNALRPWGIDAPRADTSTPNLRDTLERIAAFIVEGDKINDDGDLDPKGAYTHEMSIEDALQTSKDAVQMAREALNEGKNELVRLTPEDIEELKVRYAPRADTSTDVWGENPTFPRQDWKDEVVEGNTNLGYWEWVKTMGGE